jgi:hypothetical protein
MIAQFKLLNRSSILLPFLDRLHGHQEEGMLDVLNLTVYDHWFLPSERELVSGCKVMLVLQGLRTLSSLPFSSPTCLP